MYGVRKCPSFNLLQVVDQFSQHHLLKRLSLIHCIFLPPLSKIRCPYVRGFISGLSILFPLDVFLLSLLWFVRVFHKFYIKECVRLSIACSDYLKIINLNS